MEPIRTLVVDDERPARSRLVELLEKHSNVELAGTACDGQEAVHLIRQAHPDLVFLDIQMPLLDGFGVLREIGPESMPATVFVTAYDQYAIQAFETHALDYLLKPFSDERFDAAFERVRGHFKTRAASELGIRLASLLSERQDFGYLERIILKTPGRVMFLDVAEIDWVEAEGVYVVLHVGAKSYLHRATVGQLEQRLDPKSFVRIHRSAIVNTGRIRELQPRAHGDCTLLLKDGTELTLSRGYRPQLEGWLRQPL